MNISLIIFDCDGVLVDSERLANTIFAQAITEAGLPTTMADAMERYKGLSMSSAMSKIEETLGRRLPDGWLDDVRRRTDEQFRRHLRAVDGVADLIARLRSAGLDLCVASSGGHEKMALTLALTGLKAHFGQAVFSAHDVGRGKPYPDLFLHAARTMGHEPETCVVIEDSLPGIKAGVAADMRVLAYAADPLNNADEMMRAGAEVFYSMTEVPFLLGV